MDAVSDRRFGAIASPASVGGPAQAGSVSQPYGTPASSVGSTGCSFGVHTELVPASLWPVASGCGRTGSRFPVRPQTRAAAGPRDSEYPEAMNESSSRSLGRTVIAGLVLLVAAWLLLHFVIGIVTAIASVLVVVLAIVALVWALRVLL
jgi:hypothetical protein